MTWMRAIGGPAHDDWFNVPPGYHNYVTPALLLPTAWTDEPFDPLASLPEHQFVYTVEKLVWPGFRFPIRVLVAPGVEVQGHVQGYDSSWPNPLVPARCRCEDLRAWVFRNDYSQSACHLDHCPVHGRWTFPPITPMWVSEQARDLWRFPTDKLRKRARR